MSLPADSYGPYRRRTGSETADSLPSEQKASPLTAHYPSEPQRHGKSDADLTARLAGSELPDIYLPTQQKMNLRLLSHIGGTGVVYMIPGGQQPATPAGTLPPDIAQVRGYANRVTAFVGRRIKVVGIVSESLDSPGNLGESIGSGHFVFYDDELQVAKALALPLIADGEKYRQPRITLVTKDGRIEHAFYPIADDEAAGNARQVMAWMQRRDDTKKRRRRR